MNPIILISGEKNLFHEGYNGCGVYAFSGLAPSSFECPIYIGSSASMKRRITYDHFPELNNNEHGNKPLQNYFNLHGAENLVVWNLENCEPEKLLEVEQKYIDFYGTVENGRAFNIAKFAGAPTRGIKFSDEIRKKVSDAMKGKKKSKEARKSMSEAKSKSFKIISPDGEIIEGSNLRKFCLDNGLMQSSMWKVLNGKRNHHKNWTAENPDLTREDLLAV
jgi:group I intron endonuclease